MFLEKIGKELEEKERLDMMKKKAKTEEDYLREGNFMSRDKGQEREESKEEHQKKKQPTKKIYPISIAFHQKSRMLAICLIDCEIKIYRLKMQGTVLQVHEH